MNNKKQLEIRFFQKDQNSTLKDPVLYDLTLLDNGSYCLPDIESYQKLFSNLHEWQTIHVWNKTKFELTKTLYDEF